MASTVVPPDIRWTDVIPLPTQTATQLTGAPSASPKEPVPRTSSVPAAGVVIGSTVEPVPTAWSVESSITSWPQDAVVDVVPEPEVAVPEPEPVTPAPELVDPDELVPVVPVPTGPVVACGAITGSAQMVPVGHVTVVGGLPGTTTGGEQVTVVGQPPVVPEPAE